MTTFYECIIINKGKKSIKSCATNYNHLIIMNKKTTNKKNMQHDSAYDIKLLFPVLVLVGAGLIMVYSASFNIALSKFGTDYYFLKKQAFLK